MTLFGIVGWSGSGKTTLIEALLPKLIGRGLSVSTMKHTHHTVDLDQPGKDTFRHRQVGATEVVMVSSSRWTLMHELRGATEPTPEQLAERVSPVDLMLIEGFKALSHDKLEVYRASVGKPPLYPSDPNIVAIASDTPLPQQAPRRFDLGDIPAITEFIISHCRLLRS